MGNTSSKKIRVSFEDMTDTIIRNPNAYILINTLPTEEQDCLIFNTISADKEESIVNNYLSTNKHICIIVYGKNCNDLTIETKYKQLVALGFKQVHVYLGGMFEWIILQDIYGRDNFPTIEKHATSNVDILRFKPQKLL
jgi:hypothetical protein